MSKFKNYDLERFVDDVFIIEHIYIYDNSVELLTINWLNRLALKPLPVDSVQNEEINNGIRDAHTEFRTLRAPYSSYSVLVKMAVPRAKIRTPGVRYSSYSVLSVPGAENNDRAPY